MVKFNQEFVYPDSFRIPSWVESRVEKFHNEMLIISEKNISEKIRQDMLIDNLENNILHEKVKITKVLTSAGIGELLNKLDKVTNDVEFMWYYYLLMQAGFTLSTYIPSSFEPEALELPKEFIKEKDILVKKYQDSNHTTEDALAFNKGITKIAEKVKKYFEDNKIAVVDLMNSGAKGNVGHIQSLLLSVGLSINSHGEINDVIDNSHVEGMSQSQFYNNSSQAIQALYAKSSETAVPGYAGRKLSAISERIKLSKDDDCGTQNYLKMKIRDAKMLESFAGRYYKSKLGMLREITINSDLVGDIINIRSPLYCRSKDGICKTCYNKEYLNDMGLTSGSNIGLIASTGLTGNLVSLTLKKSHVGVGLDKENVDFRKEIINL